MTCQIWKGLWLCYLSQAAPIWGKFKDHGQPRLLSSQGARCFSLSLSLGVPLPLNVSKKPAGRVSRWHEQLGLVTGLTAKHTPAQRCVYIYTPGGFIAIKYIAMISYDMIYQLHIVMKLNDTFPALVKFTIIFRLDSLVLQRRNVRRNMIVPIALDVNVDWLWDQWMTPNEQHWIYGKMLGERREGSKRTRFFFSGKYEMMIPTTNWIVQIS